jgi:hypothetical protein
MDQVQRAYESQLRREECKRKQLQNAVRASHDAPPSQGTACLFRTCSARVPPRRNDTLQP